MQKSAVPATHRHLTHTDAATRPADLLAAERYTSHWYCGSYPTLHRKYLHCSECQKYTCTSNPARLDLINLITADTGFASDFCPESELPSPDGCGTNRCLPKSFPVQTKCRTAYPMPWLSAPVCPVRPWAFVHSRTSRPDRSSHHPACQTIRHPIPAYPRPDERLLRQFSKSFLRWNRNRLLPSC